MTTFVSLDVETANSFMGSICQIGLVLFDDGIETAAFNWLVNPNDYFDQQNIAIHGIDERTVAGAPRFAYYHTALYRALNGAVVVHHTYFDRVSINQACAAGGLPPIDCIWLDSAKVVRRTWSDVAYRGYGLAPMAERLGIIFQHHDAENDARAAGHIMLHAVAKSGLSIDEWLARQRQPITPRGPAAFNREAIGEGPLEGETVVFTGQLEIHRHTAADLAQAWGAAVEGSVNKRTTILVVGNQDLTKLSGHTKSSKHRKADAMIAEGYPIRIIAEMDFIAIGNNL